MIGARKQKSRITIADRGLVAALLMLAALIGSVFFQGMEVWIFSLVFAFLLLQLLRIGWRAQSHEPAVPRSTVALWLTLLWAWLCISLTWSPALYLSVFSLWWFSALPFAFWLYTLTPDRQRLWPAFALGALLVGLGLAAHACFQFFALDQVPMSTFLNFNSYAALLSLIALPTGAYFLAHYTDARFTRWQRNLLALGFFILVYAIALTKGRAVAFSFGIGFLIVAAVAYRRVPARAIAWLAGLTGLAYALAAISSRGQLLSRFAELREPLTVGSVLERLQLWEAAWRMIQDAPWWGTGLSMFALHYPAYREPTETSAGYFVHNEYLQLWLEVGLPGLVLLLVAMIAVVWMFTRALRSKKLRSDACVEMAGLFAGLTAIAAHSFFDFDLHVLAIMIVAGVALARFQEVAGQAIDVRTMVLRPPSLLSAPIYRTALVLLVAFPALFLTTVTIAVRETERGHAFVKQGRFDLADRSFQRAHRLYPTADNALVDHADLYRHVLTFVPRSRLEDRQEVFARARASLDQAERLNPLRPLTFLVRASLYQQNPDLVGADAGQEIESALRRALELNPRFYSARLFYAQFLHAAGRSAAAHAVTEAGLQEFYIESRSLAPYLGFAGQLRVEVGDREGAEVLRQRTTKLLKQHGWTRIERPEEAKPLTITLRSASLGQAGSVK